MRALAVLALLLALSAPALAASGPVTAVASVDRPWMRIGDPLLLMLVVDAAPGYQVLDPGVGRAVGPFEVLEVLPARQDRFPDGAVRLTFRYRITVFALGEYTLPALEVVYQGPGGEGTVKTEPLAIEVKTVTTDVEDLSDIKPLAPQLELPGRLQWFLTRILVPAAGALALLVPALSRVRLRRPKRVAPPPVIEEQLTPARRALRELQRIAALGLPAQGRLAEHYELLNEALRSYLAEKYGLGAAGRTARELLGDMRRAGVDPRQAATLHEILRDRELVRFQGFAPYPRHAEQAVGAAIEICRRVAMTEGPTVREEDLVAVAP